MQRIHKDEKKMIERLMEQGAPLLNQPPLAPYLVETDLPMQGDLMILEGDVPPSWMTEESFDMKLRLDAHVESAAKIPCDILSRVFLAPRFDGDGNEKYLEIEEDAEWVVFLDYPLSVNAFFAAKIPSWRNGILPIGGLVWLVAMGYRGIYAEPQKYGVWGHAMDDLYMEIMVIDTKNHRVRCFIGS